MHDDDFHGNSMTFYESAQTGLQKVPEKLTFLYLLLAYNFLFSQEDLLKWTGG